MIQLDVYIVVVLITELFLTLHYPVDCSPSGSSVHGVFQARILGWVAMSYSRGSFQPPCLLCLPHWQVDSLPLCHLGSPVPCLLWVKCSREPVALGEGEMQVPGASSVIVSTRGDKHKRGPWSSTNQSPLHLSRCLVQHICWISN